MDRKNYDTKMEVGKNCGCFGGNLKDGQVNVISFLNFISIDHFEAYFEVLSWNVFIQYFQTEK